MTTALAVPDTTGIQSQTLNIADWATALVVADAGSYRHGAERLVTIKGVLKQIDETFNKPISDAHTAHKTILAAKKKHAEPLQDAERIVKGKMTTWKREEEAKQAEARRWLEEQERKREEDRRLAEAERLEAQGRAEEAEQVIEAPVVIAPIVMPSAAPKVEGVSTRKVWKYRVFNAALLPKTYLVVNEKAISATVRAMGAATSIPGVEVYQEDVMAVRGA